MSLPRLQSGGFGQNNRQHRNVQPAGRSVVSATPTRTYHWSSWSNAGFFTISGTYTTPSTPATVTAVYVAVVSTVGSGGGVVYTPSQSSISPPSTQTTSTSSSTSSNPLSIFLQVLDSSWLAGIYPPTVTQHFNVVVNNPNLNVEQGTLTYWATSMTANGIVANGTLAIMQGYGNQAYMVSLPIHQTGSFTFHASLNSQTLQLRPAVEVQIQQ